MGGALLLCYDILVVLRKVIPHCKWVVAAEDIFFWIFAGFTLFAGIYRGNEGKLRNFLFLGSALGFCLCRVTLSPVFVSVFIKILEFPVFLMKKTFCLCRVTLSPVFVSVFIKILEFPVFLMKKTVKRLLFPVKRCKIFLKNNTLSKRLEQIEKKQEKKKSKKNRI